MCYGYGVGGTKAVHTLNARNIADAVDAYEVVVTPGWMSWCCWSSSVSGMSVVCRVRVRGSVSTPKYKWGSVSHNSVGVVTSLCPNGRDITVDFPMQGNWTGLQSEMEIVPR